MENQVFPKMMLALHAVLNFPVFIVKVLLYYIKRL